MRNGHGQFTALAAQYELPRQIVGEFEQLYALSPSVARDLIRQLAESAGIIGKTIAPAAPAPRHAKLNSNFDLMRAAVKTHGPLTKKQFAEHTGLTDGMVHTVLYKTNRKDFEPRAVLVGNGRMKAYTLAEKGGQ